MDLFTLLLLALLPATAAEPAKDPRAPLQPFNDLIGSWKGTGSPEGTAREKQRGFWSEAHRWQWQFKGHDAWLTLEIDQGKHFRGGELRYLADQDRFQLRLTPAAGGDPLTFAGKLADRTLTVERTDAEKKETQRLSLALLHDNRVVYRYETKPEDSTLYRRQWQVGAIKDGVPFAGPANAAPECVVSGGLGTMQVSYKGQAYYVCCSGCRDAFKDDPEKYVKEFQEKQKEKKGK
jgi:ribosomal protein L24E